MEGRMTVCNMSIEWGAKAGLIAPDQTTFDYIEGRPEAPKGADWDAALAYWKTLVTDDDAEYDAEIVLDASEMTPFVTWGTNPGQGVPLGGAASRTPTTSRTPRTGSPPRRRCSTWRSRPAPRCARSRSTPSSSAPAPTAGSRTCALAAEIVKGRHVDKDTRLLVVPGSVRVRLQAEDEGLDVIFKEAGAEWRGAGCSMCLGMNPDTLQPGERSASTSNRNFEGRQGKGGRTHLVSVPVAAATAIRGTLSSPADLDPIGADSLMEAVHQPHRRRRPAAPQQRRHRPDHPGGLPQAGQPHRLRGRPVRRVAQRPRLRAQPPGVRRRLGARRRPRLRHRLVARARRVGAEGLRLPRRDLAAVRRHLPRQLRQGRPARGEGRREGRAATLGPPRRQPRWR